MPDPSEGVPGVSQAISTYVKAVDEHGRALANGDPLLGDPLGADSEIVTATKQVFRILLGAELGLKAAAFDQDEKEDALELQANRDVPDHDEGGLDTLIELFTELCDRWPEVLDLRYGGTRAEFREFRTVFVPALLIALEQSSREKGYASLVKDLEAVDRHYATAIRTGGGASLERYAKDEEKDDL